MTSPRHLSKLERLVLAKLLSVDFPGKDQLNEQLHDVRVKRIDEQGSLELLPIRPAPIAAVEQRVPVEAEMLDKDGVTIHVLLHVVDGFLKELEIYRDDSNPLERGLSPEELDVFVLPYDPS